MTNEELDEVLGIQLAIAWAGEADTDPKRMGWWRTGMCDEYGGEDLLKRLVPKTWQWAVLETARNAAKKVDDRGRNRAEDPDNLITLFRLGFQIDEQLDERLLELKQSGVPLNESFPELAALCEAWSDERFKEWLGGLKEASYTATATGRRLKGKAPEEPLAVTRQLASALLPLDSKYALPYFRIGR